jgi:putative membrane protein
MGMRSVPYIQAGSEYAGVASLGLILLALPAWIGLAQTIKISRTVLLCMLLGMIAVAAEYTSITTGFPYGRFVYGEAIGWKLFDRVPWTLLVIWSPLVIGAAALAKKRRSTHLFSQLVCAVCLLVGFDLLLDPGAVGVGLWTWIDQGNYYTVPVQNFLGWMLTSAISLFPVFLLLRRKHVRTRAYHLMILPFIASLGFWGGVCLGVGWPMPAFILFLGILLWHL